MAHIKLGVRCLMTCVICLVMGIGQPFPALAIDENRSVDGVDATDVSPSKVVLSFVLCSDPPFNPNRPAQISQGDFITYRLSISNTGTLTATQVVITNAVPLGSTSVVSSWLPTPLRTSPIVWQMETLAPGETITVQHVLRVNDNITVTAIVNTAIASSSEITSPITRTTVHPFGVTSAPQVAFYFPLMVVLSP